MSYCDGCVLVHDLRAERDRLRTRLIEGGWLMHYGTCPVGAGPMYSGGARCSPGDEAVCDCGLAAALRGPGVSEPAGLPIGWVADPSNDVRLRIGRFGTETGLALWSAEAGIDETMVRAITEERIAVLEQRARELRLWLAQRKGQG